LETSCDRRFKGAVGVHPGSALLDDARDQVAAMSDGDKRRAYQAMAIPANVEVRLAHLHIAMPSLLSKPLSRH
jgi:hypothetical protein